MFRGMSENNSNKYLVWKVCSWFHHDKTVLLGQQWGVSKNPSHGLCEICASEIKKQYKSIKEQKTSLE